MQRYRLNISRQRGGAGLRRSTSPLLLSAIAFLTTAAMTTMWVPRALTYMAAGLCIGAVLGLAGLWLTRWEFATDALHYTPNRLLVLGITVLVAGRLLYGVWRGWQSWSAGIHGGSWFVAAGIPGSMAAGALVLGYYLAYWTGVRRRYRQHAVRRLRRM